MIVDGSKKRVTDHLSSLAEGLNIWGQPVLAYEDLGVSRKGMNARGLSLVVPNGQARKAKGQYTGNGGRPTERSAALAIKRAQPR